MASGHRPESVRDPLAAARHRLDEARGIHRAHLKVCYQCARAGSDYNRLCEDGWQQVKAITGASSRVRKLEDAARMQAVQGTLW